MFQYTLFLHERNMKRLFSKQIVNEKISRFSIEIKRKAKDESKNQRLHNRFIKTQHKIVLAKTIKQKIFSY